MVAGDEGHVDELVERLGGGPVVNQDVGRLYKPVPPAILLEAEQCLSQPGEEVEDLRGDRAFGVLEAVPGRLGVRDGLEQVLLGVLQREPAHQLFDAEPRENLVVHEQELADMPAIEILAEVYLALEAVDQVGRGLVGAFRVVESDLDEQYQVLLELRKIRAV